MKVDEGDYFSIEEFDLETGKTTVICKRPLRKEGGDYFMRADVAHI
jgi:hypothetical protein